nr:immunoglobulin light chain junction region [Macaca mulatta]
DYYCSSYTNSITWVF